MEEKEMLKLEEDNYSTMHLYLIGLFWWVYQRSVFLYEQLLLEKERRTIIMYRLKTIYIMLVMSTISVSSQIVTTVGGYPVVDLSGLSPLSCVLSSSEASARRTEMNAQTPSNSALLGVGIAVSGENGSWNSKMSTKYQVMRANHTVGITDWSTGYTQCKQYGGEGGSSGQWRLPTQRELQMIWILHPQLIGKGGFTSFDAFSYWISTEVDAHSAWYVGFNAGYVGASGKTGSSRVRCVRDL